MELFAEIIAKRFNANQPRWSKGDPRGGQWKPELYPNAVREHAVFEGSQVKLERSKERAFDGKSASLKRRPTPAETGHIATQVTLAYLAMRGDAGSVALHRKVNNFPTDIFAPKLGMVVEVKGGLASNGRSAWHWKVAPGLWPAEAAALAKMSPEKKRAYNAAKVKMTLGFKSAVVRQVSKQTGRTFRPTTVALVINPDKRIADVHVLNGFHAYVGWNSETAKNGYVGSFRYSRKP
jgi:hypothetical protein